MSTGNSKDKANTPEEIVDVVNENDEVIGQATKREVNSNKSLLHREIGILLYDENNRVLTQQRSKKKKAYPLYWIISVAGHVPAGMPPLESAYKEMEEELGIRVPLIFIEKTREYFETETNFVYFYIGQVSSNTKITLDLNEAEQYQFVNAKDIKRMQSAGEKFEPYSLEAFMKFWAGSYRVKPSV